MQKIAFGQLITALRKEYRNPNGCRWSQSDLAETLSRVMNQEISTDSIGRLERGETLPNGEMLNALAGVFELTTGEREEFFLAASRVAEDHLLKPHHEEAAVLAELLKRLAQVQQPAFIIDAYCDIVATNLATVKILEIEAAGLDLAQQAQKPGGLNMLQFVFSPPAVAYYQPSMGASWDSYTYHNMMLFRASTLRYRTTPYFRQLFPTLWKQPAFQVTWQLAPQQERDFFTNNEYIQFNASTWGPLTFFSANYSAITTAGKLYFCTYVPASADTAQVFSQVIAEGGNAVWAAR